MSCPLGALSHCLSVVATRARYSRLTWNWTCATVLFTHVSQESIHTSGHLGDGPDFKRMLWLWDFHRSQRVCLPALPLRFALMCCPLSRHSWPYSCFLCDWHKSRIKVRRDVFPGQKYFPIKLRILRSEAEQEQNLTQSSIDEAGSHSLSQYPSAVTAVGRSCCLVEKPYLRSIDLP